MRLYPALALMSSAFALAACGGGGGLSDPSVRAQTLDVCYINNTSCDAPPKPVTPAAALDSDGDGIPDSLDTDGSVGSGGGGNNTGTSSGTRTIAIQASKLDKPTTGKTALSLLTSALTPTHTATEAAILSANKPKSMKFSIDTKSASNTNWAVPIEQKEYVYGTRDLAWIMHNHTTEQLRLVDTKGNAIAFASQGAGLPMGYFYTTTHTSTSGVPITAGSAVAAADLASPYYTNQLNRFVDRNGNPILYFPGRNEFIYTVTHTSVDGTFAAGSSVDTTSDFYWNMLTPYMGTKANGGAKGEYREYRIIDSTDTVNRDEFLQVWDWGGNSYTTHYGNRSGGADPKQQAWSYGGKSTINMPTSGKATYKGRFVGNAKTSNWTPADGADIDPNADWRVQGRSEVIADFGTNKVSGTLATESWTSYQQKIKSDYTWYTGEAGIATPGNILGEPSVGTSSAPNYSQIYEARVGFEGTLVAGDQTATTLVAGVPTTTPIKNNFDGTATLNGKYISSNNVMYGGFFGDNGTEVTGIFNVSGTLVDPIGGSAGLNGDRAAYLDMSGSFNANCATDPTTGKCLP